MLLGDKAEAGFTTLGVCEPLGSPTTPGHVPPVDRVMVLVVEVLTEVVDGG